MGDLTFTDFKDEVRFRLGGVESGNPAITNARVGDWTNWAYQWVCQPRVYRHPNLEVTLGIPLVEGVSEYVPEDSAIRGLFQIYAVNLSDDTSVSSITLSPNYDRTAHRRQLRPTTWRKIQRIQTSTGLPTRYTRWRTNLFIDRAPSSADAGKLLLVDAYARPAKLTQAASDTLIEPEWDEVISVGAAYRGWLALGDPEMAEDARENFGRQVNEIASQFAMDGDDEPIEMNVEGAYDSMDSFTVY